MANKKILIADDDEGIVDAVTMILEVMGYEVEFTYDGGEVLEAVKNKPDLILLDIWMSGHDGRDICRQLKSDPKYQGIPILMISASRNIKQSALDAGANDFMEKPFEMDSLLNKVDSLLLN
ncbi:response regulator [Pedobacter mucosus]|uniref:response regulator n=1 Tax=Pedobacter mucosus TaxID=2895286 RepID=UPI001EE3B1B9|nr:response regulator transcription factor [Pedobacter mucosus]UKT64086.1 response regulator transcription factor [Pedobacter mucosus]